jgi:hypothetical protein
LAGKKRRKRTTDDTDNTDNTDKRIGVRPVARRVSRKGAKVAKITERD